MSFAQSMWLLAQNTPGTGSPAADVPQGPNTWIVLLIFLSVVILPFVLGNLLAQWLRVKEHSLKMGITLFSLVLALSPFVTALVNGQSIEDCFRLGIDLEGGTNMVFQIDHDRAADMKKEVSPQLMDNMVTAIRNRVNVSGVEEIIVRQVGDDSFEVIVPGNADPGYVEQVKNRIVDLGSLEISILANDSEHQAICQLGEEAAEAGNKEVRQGDQIVASWRPVGVGADGEPKLISLDHGIHQHAFEHTYTLGGEPVTDPEWPHYLVVVETNPELAITGDLLEYAEETTDRDGLPAVGFTFNLQGGHRFQYLTSRHLPQPGNQHRSHLAIVLSGEIHSAPVVETLIAGGRGIIHGSFTPAEVRELTGILNAGALEVPLKPQPISDYQVSPMLGKDVRDKGVNAILWSAVAICVFMLMYYLLSGIVACICVACNILMIMGVMALIDATFTLPGLAGMVLTIGMAVDANVLIYERMREEMAKGSSVRMAIQNGFSKALSSIVDSNLTTMITGIVLYIIGTDQVKGFAVTLCIGIIMTMFTVLYVGRLIFDICERNRWITSLKMLGPSKPFNFRFFAKTWPAVIVSVLLIGAGMAAMFVRGKENFDIDFRGGSMVTFSFAGTAPEYDQVQAALLKQFEVGATIEELKNVNEQGEQVTLFRLRTTIDDLEQVTEKIVAAFESSSHELLRQDVDYASDITAIPLIEEGEEGESTAPADEFAGGHERAVTVEVPVAASTLQTSIVETLESLTANAAEPPEGPDAEDAPLGAARYPDATSLVEVVATDDSETGPSVQRKFDVRLAPEVTLADAERMFTALESRLEQDPIYAEATNFKSSVAQEVMLRAIGAILVSFIAIVAYLWFRFQSYSFGVAAVVALVHDVLAVLGMMALCSLISGNSFARMLLLEDFKINLPIVAAILTLMGYSLNDTIVTFDRIREIRGRSPKLTVEMVDASVNQTLSRTILTALTVLIVVLILYIWGGEGIHGFAFSLLIGVFAGTYSSIYMAAPVLMWLINRDYERATAAANQRRVGPAGT